MNPPAEKDTMMTRFAKLTAGLFVTGLAILPIAVSAQPAATDNKPAVPATAAATPAAKHTVAVTPPVKHAATPATGADKAATPAATTQGRS